MMTRLIGHRGAPRLAPENTLPSFAAALKAGASGIECDVRLSSDGVPIVFHDDRLERLTPGSGRVNTRSAAELTSLPVLPGAFGGSFPDVCIPTLGAVLDATPPNVLLVIELKVDEDSPTELVAAVLKCLPPNGRCFRLISFDAQALVFARSAGVVTENLGLLRSADQAPSAISAVVRAQCAWLHLGEPGVDPGLIGRARDAGIHLNAWTVNVPQRGAELRDLGVDELTTDDPLLLPQAM